MIRDPGLLDLLSGFPVQTFAGELFRITRRGLDALAPSTAGGRWAPRGGPAVLYTSLEREGALAEISFHWGQLTPLPSKPALQHRLAVRTSNTLRLILADLTALGVEAARYDEVRYTRTAEIGDAVGFLGFDGLLVPSARWHCENLVIFPDNHATDPVNALTILDSQECDWLTWARDNGRISADET